MICPFCLHDKTRVEHTRAYDTVNFRWRRCEVCGKMFTTEEVRSDEKALPVVSREGGDG